MIRLFFINGSWQGLNIESIANSDSDEEKAEELDNITGYIEEGFGPVIIVKELKELEDLGINIDRVKMY